MAYVFPIHPRYTYTLYNQKTIHLIGQCDDAIVTDSHFEYANQVVKFSEILFKNGTFVIHEDSGVQHFIDSHTIYIYNKIHHRRVEEAFNRSMQTKK